MTKLGCPKTLWEREARHEAAFLNLCPGRVLAGDKRQRYVHARWYVWRKLVSRGYSANSIAKASGYDHSSVFFACRPEMRQRRYARYYEGRDGRSAA